MFRFLSIIILILILAFYPFPSLNSPFSLTHFRALLPIQAEVVSINTPQKSAPITPVVKIPTNTPQHLTPSTPTTEQVAISARIPSHFTSFAEPRDTPTCNQSDTSSQKPLFSKQLSLARLKNIRYLSAETFQTIQLHNGYYLDPTLAASFSSPPAQNDAGTLLIEPIIRGYIDHDGGEDAVVMLKTRSGGTGTWLELAIILNHQPEPENIATIYFSDRDIIKDITIINGDIAITTIIHQVGDGLCCPSRMVQKTFRLCQGNMIEIKNR